MKYLLLIALVLLPFEALASPISGDKIIELVNIERFNAGLKPIQIFGKLMIDADTKAMDMADKSYFSHTTPEGNDLNYFLRNLGKNFFCGENLAEGFNSSEQIVSSWMNSPTHKRVLLTPSFTKVGIASIAGKFKGRDTYFTTLYMCH